MGLNAGGGENGELRGNETHGNMYIFLRYQAKMFGSFMLTAFLLL